MIMAVGLTVLKIGRSQSLEEYFRSLKCNLGLLYTIEMECVINGLPLAEVCGRRMLQVVHY